MMPALLLSVGLAVLLLAMVRFGAPRWSFLLLGVLLPAALFFLAPAMRVYFGAILAGGDARGPSVIQIRAQDLMAPETAAAITAAITAASPAWCGAPS